MKYQYLTGRSIMPDGMKSTKLTCFECGEPQLSSNHTVDNKNICHSCKSKDEEGLLEEKSIVYKIITLCGSTKFKDEFLKAQKELTLQGYIVISVEFFEHGDYQTVLTDDIKIMLDDMHKRKIDMSNEIFVINKDGYIGESTRNEIEYAIRTDKVVNYLEEYPYYIG